LKLFGYKPDRTILQVHIAGFFKKKKYPQRQLEKYRAAVNRYGGVTFVIVGRTHDPSTVPIPENPHRIISYTLYKHYG
jgi:hypothetical protein